MLSSRQMHDEVRRREKPEPTEGASKVPWYVLTAVLGLLTWGFVYLLTVPHERAMPAPVVASAGAAVDGAAVFTARCQACHQTTGLGLPGVFPPLAGSEWVSGDPGVMVQILLHGLSGEIEVNGSRYAGLMPAFGQQLTDAELAAVASYVRGSWGNEAAEVDAAFVKSQRAKTSAQAGPWQGQEALDALAAAP